MQNVRSVLQKYEDYRISCCSFVRGRCWDSSDGRNNVARSHSRPLSLVAMPKAVLDACDQLLRSIAVINWCDRLLTVTSF